MLYYVVFMRSRLGPSESRFTARLAASFEAEGIAPSRLSAHTDARGNVVRESQSKAVPMNSDTLGP